MIVNKGTKTLLIRYSDYLFKGCIEAHAEIIKKEGFCWFGKVGRQKPSKKYVEITLGNATPFIILHSVKHAYLCRVEEIIDDCPLDGIYPTYYKEVLFDKGNIPSAFFKLTSCIEIPKNVLSSFVVSSSRNNLSNALRESMTSLFLVECISEIEVREEKKYENPI